MTLDALKNLEARPINVDSWLDRFNEEDRATVIKALEEHSPSRVFPIISTLEDNPFPFQLGTLQAWKKRNLNEQY
ncbi:hypothetical protein ACL1FJ_00585 [Corynebacterium striatum]